MISIPDLKKTRTAVEEQGFKLRFEFDVHIDFAGRITRSQVYAGVRRHGVRGLSLRQCDDVPELEDIEKTIDEAIEHWESRTAEMRAQFGGAS